ncbi:MAG: hypothetical protein WC058_01130, partial [Phycisphaeraceae bacterium]
PFYQSPGPFVCTAFETLPGVRRFTEKKPARQIVVSAFGGPTRSLSVRVGALLEQHVGPLAYGRQPHRAAPKALWVRICSFDCRSIAAYSASVGRRGSFVLHQISAPALTQPRSIGSVKLIIRHAIGVRSDLVMVLHRLFVGSFLFLESISPTRFPARAIGQERA